VSWEDGLRRLWIIFVALIVPLLGRVPFTSADGPPSGLTMEVEVAFDGYAKYGEWLPVWVRLENSGPDRQTEVRVRFPGRRGTVAFAASASLPTGSRKRIPVYVLPNNFSHALEVQLFEGDQLLLSQKAPVSPEPNISYFVGLVAPERGAMSLLSGASLPGKQRPKVLIDLSPTDLPERPEGLRSFDCLILNDVDTDSLTPDQGAALETWVRQGGRLVIGGGAGAMRTAAGLPKSLLPLEPHDLVEVDALPALSGFAGAERVRVPGPFLVAIGEPGEGHTLAALDDLPLVRERAVGNGYADFVALDLAVSPFDAWAGTTAFWERLISPGAAYPEWQPPDLSSRQMNSGQMAQALSNLPSLDVPSIRGLGMLLVLYVVLVGPVNFFVLRWRKRLHWAWITIPLITVAFSAGAFGLGYALRGSDLVLNKIAVIELQPDGTAGVSSYLGLFSPTRQSYEIEVKDEGLLSPLNPDYYSPWVSSGVGSPGEMVFVQGDPSRVRGLAVNQWSMQTFMTEGVWTDFGRIAADLRIEGEELVGFVRNETNHTLTDAVLIQGSLFVRLGDVPPDGKVPVGMNLSGLAGERFGPIGWRLFEEQLDQPGPGGPPREAQLRQMVVDSVFQQGGTFSPASSFMRFGGGSPQGLVLLGWLDKAPPEVWVAGQRPEQQTTALLHTSLSFHLPDEGRVSLLPGLIPGAVVQMPLEGGPCGPGATSVYVGRGQAVFEFRVPEGVRDVQVEELSLALGSDGGWGQPPQTAIYDWGAETWVELDDPVMGLNVFSDAASLVSDDGRVHVRLSSEDGRGSGCLYVELGLEGAR
jgi:hypothetical protein